MIIDKKNEKVPKVRILKAQGKFTKPQILAGSGPALGSAGQGHPAQPSSAA